MQISGLTAWGCATAFSLLIMCCSAPLHAQTTDSTAARDTVRTPAATQGAGGTVQRRSDRLPFAGTIIDPRLPHTPVVAIGFGLCTNLFLNERSNNATLSRFGTDLNTSPAADVAAAVRWWLGRNVAISADVSGGAIDLLLRYEWEVTGTASRLMLGFGMGSLNEYRETDRNFFRLTSIGPACSAGWLVSLGSFGVEVQAVYCPVRDESHVSEFTNYPGIITLNGSRITLAARLLLLI